MVMQIYGGFWRRLSAFILDSVILYSLTFTVFLAGMFILGTSSALPDMEKGGRHLIMAALRLVILFNALYLFMCMAFFTYFHGICGKTPGKMFFGLRVIREDGQPVTFGTAFLRWIGYLVSSLPFNLGFIWIAFDRRKQGFHDKIAGTVVILEGKIDSSDSSAPVEV